MRQTGQITAHSIAQFLCQLTNVRCTTTLGRWSDLLCFKLRLLLKIICFSRFELSFFLISLSSRNSYKLSRRYLIICILNVKSSLEEYMINDICPSRFENCLYNNDLFSVDIVIYCRVTEYCTKMKSKLFLLSIYLFRINLQLRCNPKHLVYSVWNWSWSWRISKPFRVTSRHVTVVNVTYIDCDPLSLIYQTLEIRLKSSVRDIPTNGRNTPTY